jgi:hypothetical protein
MRLGAGEVYLGEVAKCRHQTAAVPGAVATTTWLGATPTSGTAVMSGRRTS